MKNRLAVISIVLITILLLNSCATIFFGTKQKVSINSTPSGADVYINGLATNKQTPCIVSIKRKVKATEFNKKNQYNYLLTKEGYEDYLVSDNAKFRYSSLLMNILSYGGIPYLIDIPTGAIWKYERKSNVNLSVSNDRTSTAQTIKTRSIENKLTQNETDELLREHYLTLIAKEEVNKQKEKELKRQQRAENWKIIAQGVTQGLQQYDAQQQFQNNPNAVTLTNYTNVVANNNTISSDAINANNEIINSNNTGSSNSITDAYNQSAAKIAAMQANNQAKNNVNNLTNSNQYTVPVIHFQPQTINSSSSSSTNASGNSGSNSTEKTGNTYTGMTNSFQSNSVNSNSINSNSSDAINANDKILNGNNTGSTNSITDAYNQSIIRNNALFNSTHPDNPINPMSGTVNYTGNGSLESSAVTNGSSTGNNNSTGNSTCTQCDYIKQEMQKNANISTTNHEYEMAQIKICDCMLLNCAKTQTERDQLLVMRKQMIENYKSLGWGAGIDWSKPPASSNIPKTLSVPPPIINNDGRAYLAK